MINGSVSTGTPSEVLSRRLSRRWDLPPSALSLLRDIDFDVQTLPSRTSIIEEGQRATACCLILDGVTSRFQLTQGGERQIHEVHVAGDMPDLLSLHLRKMDHSLRTLSECRVAFVTHEQIWGLCRQSEEINAALWRETLIDAAIFRTSIIRVGRLPAVSRVAHLFVELTLRLQLIGRAEDNHFNIELSQQEMGDVLALSFVSVNRALKELRSYSIVRLINRYLTILDWDKLVSIAQFEDTYLHLKE
ncbi:Crp/Fnr family transcriptional regulator [Aureimonas psammosilenae]|uniref:Crp/Fnr family transcriptional regulator n=1 Tax=Aureimonas psammosilenae TaxID=2495496 RepID=UPI0012605420